MVGAFIANYIVGISTIWIILAVIALGVALTLWRTRTQAAEASVKNPSEGKAHIGADAKEVKP